MKFSIIIPSFNQEKFIEETFANIRFLKHRSHREGYEIEVLLFDNCSNADVQSAILRYEDIFDHVEVKEDLGQFDAINKGIKLLTGEYWTWLNTDDLLNVDGFLKLAEIVSSCIVPIDYIYGDLEIINERSELIRYARATDLSFKNLVNKAPGIYQPGSFFRKAFTDSIGILENYKCCFDYDYVLRLLQNNGKIYKCNFPVAKFRLYSASKSGSVVSVFIKEQLLISKNYGRNLFSQLTLISYLRLLKRFFIN